MTQFDPSAASTRIAKFWSLGADFGLERDAYDVYLHELVSDRYVLVNGMQLLRDELQFAGIDDNPDVRACGADFSLPSVCTTLAHTNCGDRIHQGEATSSYENIVASRFATLSEMGEFKLEAFSPTGGGTDDGRTLAHVTVAHQLDKTLRHSIYQGNAQSYVLVAIDLKTHCGRLDQSDGAVKFGETQESRWREPRAACGAVVGCLAAYDQNNAVHRRLRADLGEDNFAFLTAGPFLSKEKINVTAAVAAAIVAIQGMQNTLTALTSEMDERGLAHVTAAITVNRPDQDDTTIYLARGTAFNGKMQYQGLGTDARKYSARLIEYRNTRRLLLTYQDQNEGEYPITEQSYTCCQQENRSYYFD
ncbi:hypothetical protein JST97_13330 [bacterium]|nr:hypothetical protein [bacterium]